MPGILRGDLAADFTSGGFTLSERWTGCESFIFIPDTLIRSPLTPTSIWESDLDFLLLTSPRGAHYFFVATDEASIAPMEARIDAVLGDLDEEDADWWRHHLHVIQPTGWLADILAGHGRNGFAVDRLQRVRGVGSFADVYRYSDALNQAGYWPWESNLSYASYEAIHFDQQADLAARLESETATVIQLWNGEVIQELAEMDVELPADMSGYDTLEIDITMACPNPTAGELGNCGAWDYLAHFSVYDGDVLREMGRFITTYHREAHWVLDASPSLYWLRDGGTKRFRWSWAPPWNVQPTSTFITLRLSSRGKGYVPVEVVPLFQGGAFTSTYNDGRLPVDVAIPADAERVELVAVVTGHGAATFQCAEFCNHQHEFTVNGTTHLKTHPGAQSTAGCTFQVENGMTPNQGGTWWFGRGGWCPGQQVDPWVVDVTSEVTPGAVATVSYRGLFAGNDPPSDAGDIVLESWLVIYR